jgi:hypothetical protein
MERTIDLAKAQLLAETALGAYVRRRAADQATPGGQWAREQKGRCSGFDRMREDCSSELALRISDQLESAAKSEQDRQQHSNLQVVH